MKLNKALITCAIALTAGASLASCGMGGASNGVEQYVVEAKYGNADYNNQIQTLTLIDEDTYTYTCRATDSQDKERVTMDLYMSGSYTRTDNIVVIAPGYGYCSALNGDTPINMPIAEGGAMYFAAVGAQSYTFELSGNTFTVVTE